MFDKWLVEKIVKWKKMNNAERILKLCIVLYAIAFVVGLALMLVSTAVSDMILTVLILIAVFAFVGFAGTCR